ncbi:MAG: heparinase II/III family protein, partial [Clostridium celatum]|nr:heparinase II/III family protein [Clostridium celatum]
MSKVLWLYNRLKAMPPEEIAYRVKKTTTHKFNAIRFNKPTKVYEVKNINIDLDKLYSNLSNIFNKKDIYSIELNDTYSVFGEKVDLNNALDWHKGTSCNWDENISSYDFEFKNTDDIGDIRYTWEVNRHQFLLYLAAAYTKTQDMRYLDVLENNIEQWIVKNKFLKGVNWSSPMEIALRAYQWTILLFLIEKTELKNLKEKLAKSIIVSIEYVMKNLSLYSSANNHLILEVAISSLIGVCFDGVYQQKWFQKGYEILN